MIQVVKLEKGKIYVGGTIDDFQRLTGWKGGKVMYFGDHPYTDLADVTLHHGWKTAAVIRYSARSRIWIIRLNPGPYFFLN